MSNSVNYVLVKQRNSIRSPSYASQRFSVDLPKGPVKKKADNCVMGFFFKRLCQLGFMRSRDRLALIFIELITNVLLFGHCNNP